MSVGNLVSSVFLSGYCVNDNCWHYDVSYDGEHCGHDENGVECAHVHGGEVPCSTDWDDKWCDLYECVCNDVP